MARDPGSVWAPLPEAGAPDGHVKTQFIVHSTGDNGTAAATRRFFAGATLNESTFIVGWGPEDPTLQIMDSTDVADANGSANRRGISVEVAGDGKGGYNDWQRSELVRLGRWARAAHPGILPRVIPSEPEAGFGWHVMFGAPGPWAASAKVCPGGQRIAELNADIFPAIFTDQEDDMYGSNERNEVVGRLDEAIGLLRAIHPAVASMQVGLMDPTSGVRPIVLKLAGRDPVQVDARELAAAMVPLLAPALAAKTGTSRQDIEDVFRSVLGGLDGVTA